MSFLPRLYSVLALLFCLSWTAIGLTADRLATVRMAMESIRAEGLQSDVNYLADDAREGREAGTPAVGRPETT